MNSNNILIKHNQNVFLNDNFRDVVLSFGYSRENCHLKIEEFETILESLDELNLAYFNNSSIDRSKHINGYKATISKFPDIKVWEKAPVNEKLLIMGKSYSNLLYYYIVVILGRISCDLSVLNSGYISIDCLNKKDLSLIDSILRNNLCCNQNYGIDSTIRFLNKLIIYNNKYLYELTEKDLYNFLECSGKVIPSSKTAFKVLKHLNIIDKNLIYGYLIKKNDIEIIKKALCDLNYNGTKSWKSLVTVLNKIIIGTGKYIYEFTEHDFYSVLDRSKSSRNYGQAAFNVLKYMGILEQSLIYKYKGENHNRYDITLKSEIYEFVNAYNSYIDYINKTNYQATCKHLELEARELLNWFWKEYGEEIDSFRKLQFDTVADYVLWQKCRICPKTKTIYSKHTINGKISRLRQFLLYLYENQMLDKRWTSILFGVDAKFNNLYYDGLKKLPEPIPIVDRRKIENIINSLDEEKHFKVKRMLRLLYMYGMRPSEMLVLKLDCLVGTKELPRLHIHKAKGFKERYIPLTSEGIKIINEMQKRNKNSIAIFSDFDGETTQRLFHDKGCLITQPGLCRFFKELMIDHGLMTPAGESKYSLYVLRQIRITTWLESGISEHEVAELVGHDNVDSHNSYIISKEKRSQNTKLVYNEFYSGFIDEIVKKGRYTEKKAMSETENFDYIEKLKESLIKIESKTINMMVLDDIYKDFPEYSIPLPCGSCLAKVMYNFDFECSGMALPCLECDKLVVGKEQIQVFDSFVSKVYCNQYIREKAKIEGLVERSNALILRLKEFYKRKFCFDQNKIELHFKEIRESSIPKRGRRRNKD